jgi:hypothetical protein
MKALEILVTYSDIAVENDIVKTPIELVITISSKLQPYLVVRHPVLSNDPISSKYTISRVMPQYPV